MTRGGKRVGAGRPTKDEQKKARQKAIFLNVELINQAMQATGINRPTTAVRRLLQDAIEREANLKPTSLEFLIRNITKPRYWQLNSHADGWFSLDFTHLNQSDWGEFAIDDKVYSQWVALTDNDGMPVRYWSKDDCTQAIRLVHGDDGAVVYFRDV